MLDTDKKYRIIGPRGSDLVGLEGTIEEIASHPYGAHFGNVYLVHVILTEKVRQLRPGRPDKVWHNEADLEVIE